MRHSRNILLALAVAALVAAPAVLSPSLVNATIQMLIAVLFAMAFNLLSGQGGMLSFGHAAYFGVGAFATVHAMNAVGGNGLLPTPLLPLAGGAAGLAIGLAAGWFATKRTGVYFAMITLALAELLHALAPHIKSWFGGEAGISTMRMPAWGLTFGDSHQVYYLTLAWVLLSLALLYLYTLTPVGRLTLGLRENANRLRFLGYDVHRLSVLVFAISTTFSGIAGGLQAINMEAANYVVFESSVSAAVVLNSYIGGVKVFLGPALGAALMTFFGYAVSDLTRSWLLYQGIVFVLVMLFMPAGISGLLTWWVAGSKTYGARRLLPIAVAFVAATLLLAGGTVFGVELLQRFFSQDYRALAALNGGAGWPPIPLFGREWAPLSPLTWLPPAVLVGAGALLARRASQRWQRLREDADTTDIAAGDAIEAGRNPA
ncbi:branched-chain amino acid ABC transporter permease [Cupriavidus oxalaticus]|uniref:Branched-chain amino acid ABC transporter permease n=1 Tax=Cupriavidus oxalaticus TaxID=96344 RepID=A0A976GAK5_9BURK|nr:branched-chain amino acid ABC transporter permease [Cupriavidus oxalaticus]QRQ87698.1 branched-chain amino acid ABC transporter permease [Cupriavidus oxalaticus]QRQ93975.1 branched-chain amino acid ABC transporter permease [Cupriavidus oxalaticus]WQD82609.1 branched-chain amino acid ABC transporter permease [Cupriavidus oxalaticus]SPC15104.1 Permease of branched-chain amino acid transport system [Cupriavidus oxalaticus]